MWVELILLFTLSILTARFLEKRYKVASIAHSILFIVMTFVYLLVWDFTPIKEMWTSWMGEEMYDIVSGALKDPMPFFNAGISSFMVFEVFIFLVLPILSIVAFVDKFKEQIKKIVINLRYRDQLNDPVINMGINPDNGFIDTYNETYLVFGKLLN